jgi:hypothetical protein
MSTTLKMDNGDLLLSASGRFVECSGVEKCAQDMAEVLLNNYDSENPGYFIGSELYKLDGMTFSLGGIDANMMIETFVRDAIKRLMEAQENDPSVENAELIDEIRTLRAQKIGMMSHVFFLKCVTNSDMHVETTYSINLNQQLPGSVATTGAGFTPGTGTTR